PLAWGAARCMAGCMAGAGLWNSVFGSCDDLGDVTRNCALECAAGFGLGKLIGGLRGLGGPPLPCEINSFTGDTVVHVKPSGASQQDAQQGQATLKAISQLQVGDEVLALAEWKDKGTQAQQDQRLSYEKVTDIFTSFKEQTLVHLTLANGQQLSATEGHPFLTTEGWRDAVMLKKGGKLLLKGGEEDSEPALEITEIRTERKTLPVYNIEVANAHTYFVGIDGVVVHNAGFVFRGDGRPPNVIFDEGFAPRGPNEDLLKYARDNVPSIYVGTSKSPIVARFFAYKEDGYAYTIRWPANGIDVNEVLGPESPHLRELEIAVPGAIKPSEIMGCRRVRGNRMVGPFIKNPNWVP
ncbi:MAG: polymorphic toxin-type HINT domain-containing protein, partial [bacterium]